MRRSIDPAGLQGRFTSTRRSAVCSRSPFGDVEHQQARQPRVPALRQQRAAPGDHSGDGCAERRRHDVRDGSGHLRPAPGCAGQRSALARTGRSRIRRQVRKRLTQFQLPQGLHHRGVRFRDRPVAQSAAALHDRVGHGHLSRRRSFKRHDQDEPSTTLSFDRRPRADRVRIGAGPRRCRCDYAQACAKAAPADPMARMARAVGNGKPGAAVSHSLRLRVEARRRHADGAADRLHSARGRRCAGRRRQRHGRRDAVGTR